MDTKKNSFGSDLIIGVLTFLMVSLSFFSYNEYNENKKNTEVFENEKKVIDYQFTEIINSLDNVRSDNKLIKEELAIARNRINSLRDSLQTSGDLASIFRYKTELLNVNKDKERLLGLIAELDDKNKELIAVIDGKDQEIDSQKSENNQLSSQNNKLKADIKKAATVKATSFKADGIRVKSNGKIIIEDRYRRTEKIRVCFTMAENLLATPEKKNIYVQIINPKNNLIGEKIKVDFKKTGKELIYSTKAEIDYDRKALNLCVFVDAQKGELVKGNYFINIFDGERKVGQTTLDLR